MPLITTTKIEMDQDITKTIIKSEFPLKTNLTINVLLSINILIFY